MQEQLNRIEAKVDKLDDTQHKIMIVQAEQHITLQEHMRRSEANERAVAILKDEVKAMNSLKDKLSFTLKVIGYFIGLVLSSGIIKVILEKMFLH